MAPAGRARRGFRQLAGRQQQQKQQHLRFIADRGVQLHGGWGYMWEYPVCKAFVDARVQSIYGGANEIMKELIARSITNPRK